MLKITKFGGSSVANAEQFKKIKVIIQQDPTRRYIVVSAPGKRFAADNKITDLLYLLDAHRKYHVDASSVFKLIKNRFIEIKNELGLKQKSWMPFTPILTKCPKLLLSVAVNISVLN